MKPIRVLHVTEELSAAGIESFIMNIYRNIDRAEVQFDFLVLRNEKEFYDDEIRAMGGKKYCIESNAKNTLLRVFDESKKIEAFLRNNKYEIVHIHYTTPLRAPILKACLSANVPVRIYHSHSAFVPGKAKFKMFIYAYMKMCISKYGTHFFACSNGAAKWVFSNKLIHDNKVDIVHNGIDVNRFRFNKDSRDKKRIELNISEDGFVVIHTGRFTQQKNQLFLLNVFEYVLENVPNSYLVLLGDGEDLPLARQRVKEMHMEAAVHFMGVKNNVNEYLSMADCFVMPSLYEGLPVAAIEAQASGLPCVLSDAITDEVRLSENVCFLSLKDSVECWGDQIIKHRGKERSDGADAVIEKGYDISDVARKLEDVYKQMIKV